jgi:hypothetical protein
MPRQPPRHLVCIHGLEGSGCNTVPESSSQPKPLGLKQTLEGEHNERPSDESKEVW